MANSSLSELALPRLATLLIGTTIPLVIFFATKALLKMSVSDAAALAAHCGSIAAVTFMAGLSCRDSQQVTDQGYRPPWKSRPERCLVLLRQRKAYMRLSDSRALQHKELIVR